MLQSLITLSPLFFPTYLLRFTLFGIPFNVLECFTYLLFALWYFERLRDRKSFVWNPLHRHWFYSALLLLMGASLGAVFTPHFVTLPDGNIVDTQRIALGVWKGWVVAPLLYFIVVSQVVKTPQQVEKIFHHFIYSASLLSLLSYGYALFGSGLTWDYRLRGMFESANYLALFITPALVLNIWFVFLQPSNQKRHLIFTATLAILAYSLLFTQSYAAILSVFGSLVIYFSHKAIQKKINRSQAALVFATLLILFAAVFLSQKNTDKFKSFLDTENRSSTSVRLELYRVSGHLIKEHPLIGIGPGQFQNQYQVAAPLVLHREPLEWNMPHPHNLFLAFWLNAGFLGLLSLFLLLILSHRAFTYPLLALWGILLHGLFDVPFWKNDLAMIFWLILACILILQQHGTHPAKKPAHQVRHRPVHAPKKTPHKVRH